MCSFLTKIRINEELKEKLYDSGKEIVNFVNDRPLWQGIKIEQTA